jgi:large subunit ribosomal protein L18
MLEKQTKKLRRKIKIRKKIFQVSKDKPRLCVFRSNKHIYAQIIKNDKTLISASDREIDMKSLKKEQNNEKKAKILKAYEVGKLIAKKSLENNIRKVVFDRSGNKYHGRVKALAEGAREGGLEF